MTQAVRSVEYHALEPNGSQHEVADSLTHTDCENVAVAFECRYASVRCSECADHSAHETHAEGIGLHSMAVDEDVRWQVYDVTMREGAPPLAARLSASMNRPPAEISASLERLAASRMLVLRDGEVLMAGPFSAVPTPFRVRTSRFSCYGNCIWDALGIAATLQSDVTIDTSCGDCAAAMHVAVRHGEVIGTGLMHFALPARQWWQDIVFT